MELQVQSGGAFDIDYEVKSPVNKVVLSGTKERQGDFVFTAQSVGEYSFCFNNEMSTFAEKLVDFEIAVSFQSFSNFIQEVTILMFCLLNRSKTSKKRNFPRSKAPPPNRPPPSKSRS